MDDSWRKPRPYLSFTFQEDEEAFKALFTPYEPEAALEKARLAMPEGFNPDSHWLSFVLICANGGLEWALDHVHWEKREVYYQEIEKHYGYLSGGELVLIQLSMHLLNYHKLWPDGLINLRRLSDLNYELALHCHSHSQLGRTCPVPRLGKKGGDG